MGLLRRLLPRRSSASSSQRPSPNRCAEARAAVLAVLARLLSVGHSTNASGNNRSTR